MFEITGRSVFTGKPVRIVMEGKSIFRAEDAPEAAALPYLSPGFLDMQINGFNGNDYSLENLEAEHIEAMVLQFGRSGISRHLSTFITMPQDRLIRNLAVTAKAMEEIPLVKSGIAGFHLEGPFLSPEDGPRGAHNKKYILLPDFALFQKWQEAARGHIRLITLAPELSGALDFIKKVTKTGVRVSIGHSAASPDNIRAAVEAGASCSTHLGNGSHQFLPRHKNYIWEQLASDSLMASIISDGFHLPASLVKVIARAKQLERLILVSDAVILGGYKPGLHHWNDLDVEIYEDGHMCLSGTSALAGAGHLLEWDIARFMEFTGASLKETIILCTEHPARFLGLDEDDYAAFKPGSRADLTLFSYTPGDRALQIHQTFASGCVVYTDALS